MTKGAVAAGHETTAEVAAEVLRAGGNAFDAVVAAFFTACVTEPVLASVGGGGFLMARTQDRTRVFDFFTQTPRGRGLDRELDFYPVVVDFGSAQQEFHIGVGACAVPGCVRGMFAVHRALGTIPMTELVAPAVELARSGVELNALQSYILGVVEPIYMTEMAKPLFAGRTDPGRVATLGEVLRFADLADVLELLAIEGEALFYNGEIAHLMVQLCRERGGYLRAEDFKNYHVETRTPLALSYRGNHFYTNPPPSAGGVLVGFGLGVLEHSDLAPMKHGSDQHLKLLAEVMRATSSARMEHFDEGPHDGLLRRELLARYRKEVADSTPAYRGTTHVSVVDAAQNIAAMTVSNGEGCGDLVPGTGIMLNNMLGEEDLNPEGFHRWGENERMSSMMAPSILSNRDTLFALGSGGSNRIRTALLQVVSNLIDFSMRVETAVVSPRIHIETDVLNMEAGFAASSLERMTSEFASHRLFDGLNMFFGGCHVVSLDKTGIFHGIGDPRRGGVGIVV